MGCDILEEKLFRNYMTDMYISLYYKLLMGLENILVKRDLTLVS